MTIEQVRDFYDAQPFQPFVIHMADGRQVPVSGREFMASAPNGRTIIVYQPDSSFNVIDLLLVTDLESKPVTNGARRRRRSGPAQLFTSGYLSASFAKRPRRAISLLI